MKRIFGLLSIVAALTFLAGCDESRLRIDRVDPPEGVTSGGDQVDIVGAGFQPGRMPVRIAFGGHVSEQVVIASKDKINVVTPSGDKGPVDVILDFDDGQRIKIAAGFRYLDPKESGDMRKAFFNKPKGY